MAGTAILEKNREAVDALNVFPVPDGDTGTNMSLTMQSATREINSKEFLRADEAANALAKGALKGARGNSGVITSQLLRGFAKALNGVEKITPVQFAEALLKGADPADQGKARPRPGARRASACGLPPVFERGQDVPRPARRKRHADLDGGAAQAGRVRSCHQGARQGHDAVLAPPGLTRAAKCFTI